MERNSNYLPEQDFVELKWENNTFLMRSKPNTHHHRIRSDKRLSLIAGDKKPSSDRNCLNQTSAKPMKIVNFPHLASFASPLGSTRQGRIKNNGVKEEVCKIEDGDSRKTMKIGEEITVPDEHSRVFAEDGGAEMEDRRRRGDLPEDSDQSGCSGEDEHGGVEGEERATGENKRKRNTHHGQRKRKDKMRKKMRALQELLPVCNKVVDKASVLDEAIEYVKTLQHQLQVMSIPHLYTPTPTPHHLLMPTLNQFSPSLPCTGLGMGLYQGSGFGFGLSPQMPAIPGFAPCTIPYVSAVGDQGAVPRNFLSGSAIGTTSFAQLCSSSSVPPLSGYNDSSNPEDMSEKDKASL